MFLFDFVGSLLWIVMIIAIIPAVILMLYIYNKDKIEKEPRDLLWKLAGLGVLAAVFASILEMAGEFALTGQIPQDLPVYPVFYAFLVVATAEEGMKYLLMKKMTWKHPAFDYKFDAIVYCVFCSLGFAAFENIFYVWNYGFSVAVIRALISIPGHMSFAVAMGYFYGLGKLAANRGDKKASTKYLWTAFLSASLLHGFFDACLMLENGVATLVFLVFIIVLYIVIFRLIKKEAKGDFAIVEKPVEAVATAAPETSETNTEA